MASQSPRPGRGGLIALLTAWALVLGLIALAMGYVFLVPEDGLEALLAIGEPAPAPAPQSPDPEPPAAPDPAASDTAAEPGAEDGEDPSAPPAGAAEDQGKDQEASGPADGPEPAPPPDPEAPEVADAGVETADPPPAEAAEAEPPEVEPAASSEASAGDETPPAPAEATQDTAPAAPESAEAALDSAETPPDTAAAAPETAPAAADTIPAAPDPAPTAPATPAPGGDKPETTGQQVAGLAVPTPQPPAAGPWQRFAVPFDERDSRPRVALVVAGLGLADAPTEAAIKLLPAAVTLSFSPYARDLQPWIALARANGHEVMLDLPMEPVTFPADDPGPQALITTLPEEENLRRLDWILARGSAYVGLAGAMGSRFAASREQMSPVMKALKARGLLFLDNRPTDLSVGATLAAQMGVPHAINNRSIDERQASGPAIDARLVQVERVALTEGYAVAMARPFPVTMERLSAWIKTLDQRGIVLAPITALANRQSPR